MEGTCRKLVQRQTVVKWKSKSFLSNDIPKQRLTILPAIDSMHLNGLMFDSPQNISSSRAKDLLVVRDKDKTYVRAMFIEIFLGEHGYANFFKFHD